MRRLLAVVGISLAGAACGLTPVGARPPVPAGPLGPIIPAQGDTPPVECRGVPLEQCASFANTGEVDVVRYIITCTAVCTPQQGSVRIDILGSNGTTRSAGDGQYAASAPVPAPAATEVPSDPGPS
jgi:hypothetical protein